jgi:hypothetical protein
VNEIDFKDWIDQIADRFGPRPEGILFFPTVEFTDAEVEIAEQELTRRIGGPFHVIRAYGFQLDEDVLGLPHR